MTVQLQRSSGKAAVNATHSAFDLMWMMRRALLGLLILAVGVGGLAWLTHSSIDPSLDAAATPAPTSR